MVNESAVLSTGYSTYGREVLKRLHNSNKYEIAEFATYLKHNDPRIKYIPWKVYTNLPVNKEEEQIYSQSMTNEFGAFKFEQVCLNFKPHIIFDIRDVWMFTFETTSPLRKYYNLAVMPTVDSEPQLEQWLETYSKADAVFTYTDWSKEVIKKQTNNKINVVKSAPPSVTSELFPAKYEDKLKIKEVLGLSGKNIIGTVMRNQKRKLFPDLFKAFAEYITENNDKDTFLYCHTSFPDLGWDIPKLLLHYGISSRVLFTYKCEKCGNVFPSLFADAISNCKKCNTTSAKLVSVHNGVDNEKLNLIYNLFDLYIQLSQNEGYGMPLIEAATCGVPCMGTDYSATGYLIRKINGHPIKNIHMALESESSAYKSVPDIEDIKSYFKYFINLSQEEQRQKRKDTVTGINENFGSWDDTANIWMEYFDSVDINHYETKWNSKPDIKIPNTTAPKNLTNSSFIRWLITDVLCDPDQIGSNLEARFIRDLNYGASIGNYGDGSYNENSVQGTRTKMTEFNRDIAFKYMYGLRHRINEVEKIRGNKK